MRRPRPRSVVIAAAVALVVVGGAGAGMAIGRGRAAAPTRTVRAEPTVTVTRGTLAQAQTVTGQLGYGPTTAVTGHDSGTITWLPSAGATVRRGQQLYRVDDRPVTLLYGDLPLYRTLSDPPPSSPAADDSDTPPNSPPPSGDDPVKHPVKHPAKHQAKAPPPPPLQGNDVDLVATNLAALGFYDGSTTDAYYDWSLAEAVKEWQESLGEPGTGVLDAADAVVSAGPVRVDGVTAHVDDTAAEEVLTVTSTRKVITLQAPVALSRSLDVGRRISVTLPDGRRIPTRVTHVGTATAGADGGPPAVPVLVVPVRRHPLAHEPLGQVRATVVTASRTNVLRVPVAALLALAGGGYALERTDHTLVPVTIGMVTDGEVQVAGVPAGTKVVVAR